MSAPSPILRYFEYGHLPEGAMQATCAHFSAVASWVDELLPPGPEKQVALRKLLEAKDAAVRAAMDVKGRDS